MIIKFIGKNEKANIRDILSDNKIHQIISYITIRELNTLLWYKAIDAFDYSSV